MSDHPSLDEMLAVLASNMTADWLAESVVQTVERFYAAGDKPPREFLVLRCAQMITAIREGERLRLSRDTDPEAT
jgi:hypothetical protein